MILKAHPKWFQFTLHVLKNNFSDTDRLGNLIFQHLYLNLDSMCINCCTTHVSFQSNPIIFPHDVPWVRDKRREMRESEKQRHDSFIELIKFKFCTRSRSQLYSNMHNKVITIKFYFLLWTK